MTAVWLLVSLSTVMFILTLFLGVCAYRIKDSSGPVAVIFTILAVMTFIFSALSFGEAIGRVDSIEDTSSSSEIKPPF